MPLEKSSKCILAIYSVLAFTPCMLISNPYICAWGTRKQNRSLKSGFLSKKLRDCWIRPAYTKLADFPPSGDAFLSLCLRVEVIVMPMPPLGLVLPLSEDVIYFKKHTHTLNLDFHKIPLNTIWNIERAKTPMPSHPGAIPASRTQFCSLLHSPNNYGNPTVTWSKERELSLMHFVLHHSLTQQR